MVRKTRYQVLLLLTMLAVVVCSAAGDTVLTKQARSLRDVRITDFKEGRLELIDTSTGQRTLIDYDDIAFIRVDARPALKRAETFLNAREFDKAVNAYQKALQSKAASWETIWIRVRLLNILTRWGKVEQAAGIYVALAEDIPGWVISVTPSASEIGGSADQKRDAASQIIKARQVAEGTKVRKALGQFLERLGFSSDGTIVDEKGSETSAIGKMVQRSGTWLDAWAEKHFQAANFDRVGQMTEKLLATAVRADMPGILFWQGRVLFAEGRFDDAALMFLRVAIEFPGTRYAPFSLYHAADAQDKANRSKYASIIRRELIERYDDTRDLIVSQKVDEAKVKMQNTK